MCRASSHVSTALAAGLFWATSLAGPIAEYPLVGEVWRIHSPDGEREEVAVLAEVEHSDFGRVYVVRATRVEPDGESGVAATFAITEAALRGSLLELQSTDFDVSKYGEKTQRLVEYVTTGAARIRETSVHEVLVNPRCSSGAAT